MLERIVIPHGSIALAGLAYKPEAAAQGVCVVLAHGYTASKESMDLLAGYLCGRDYGCVSFDFRGHKLGGSSGELHTAAEAVADLETAAQYAMDYFERPRVILVGHSMGALVSFAVAAQRAEVVGVAAIATGPQPSRGFGGKVGQAMLAQRGDYVAGAEPRRLLEQLDSLARYVEGMGARPSLFVAARGDVLVKPEKMREMTAMAGSEAEFAEVEGSHLEAPDRARGLVAGWLDRRFRAAETER